MVYYGILNSLCNHWFCACVDYLRLQHTTVAQAAAAAAEDAANEPTSNGVVTSTDVTALPTLLLQTSDPGQLLPVGTCITAALELLVVLLCCM